MEEAVEIYKIKGIAQTCPDLPLLPIKKHYMKARSGRANVKI